MRPRLARALANGLFATLAVVALGSLTGCDTKAPAGHAAASPAVAAAAAAPPSTYASLTGKFEYRVPASWSSSVRIIEEPGASVANTWKEVIHAVHFVYQPVGPGARQQPLLSLLVYPEAIFDTAIAAKRPLAGDEVARGGGRVFAALLTTKNSYTTSSADHDRFAALLPSLDAVKGAIAPR